MLLTLVTLLLQILLVGVCLFMVLIILMQRSKNDGLGAAFGSGMTDSVFGSDTSNVLSRLTVYCAVAFFVLVLALTSIHSRKAAKSDIATKLEQAADVTPAPAPVPVTDPVPAPTVPVASEAPAQPVKTEDKPAPAPTSAPVPKAKDGSPAAPTPAPAPKP